MTTPIDPNAALALDPQAVARAQEDPEKLREAARQFEAIFIRQVFGEMRKTTQAMGAGGDLGGQFYDAMLDDRVATMATERGGIGLATILTKAWGVDEDAQAAVYSEADYEVEAKTADEWAAHDRAIQTLRVSKQEP